MLYAGPGFVYDDDDGFTQTATSEVFSLSDEEDGSRSLRETSCFIPDYPYTASGMVGFDFRGILTNCGEYVYFKIKVYSMDIQG